MSQTKETESRISVLRYKLLVNLAINGLIPYLVYILLRPLLANDVASLAIAAAIPAIRTLAFWLWRRRVDWLGVYFVLGFASALAISIFLSGNILLLKIHGTLLAGLIGLVLLVSAVIKRPLLQPFFKVFGQNGPGGTSLFERAASSQTSQARIARRISFTTTIIGLALLANMIVHVVLALTLPTAAYLGISHIATWATLGSGLALLWGTRQRENTFQTDS